MSWVVIESVAHGHRLRHRVGPDFDPVFTNDPRVGPMPLAISAGDGKLVELITIAHPQTITCLIKLEHGFPAGELRLAKHRTGFGQLATIDVHQRPTSHALADVELVFRMNVMRFADVDRHDQTCIYRGHCSATLRFT